jgi:hypothetical protein
VSKSFYETRCDEVHAYLALATGEAWRAQPPYYVYGSMDFGAVDGHPPRVRYRPTSTIVLDDRYQTTNDSPCDHVQTVMLQVWGTDENQCEQELGKVLHAHSRVWGAYFGNVTGEWLNQEDRVVGSLGAIIEVPISMRHPVEGLSNTDTTVILKHVSTDVSSAQDFDPATDDEELYQTVHEDVAP